MEWIDWGYWGLFIATFFAATVVPFSSEAMFSGAILSGFDPWVCLFVASAGNTLGGMTSYGLGYLGNWPFIARFMRVKEERVYKLDMLVKRYGIFTALLCWLPFIGDIIAIALGVFKVNIWQTALLMLIGKTGRYALILAFLTLF